jgi:hypothetical protein
MTIDKCREVLDRYEREIPDFQKRFRRDRERALDHLLTMIPKMRVMLDEVVVIAARQPGPATDFTAAYLLDEKFMRWLGFMQGVLWAEGLYTIEQLKDHNRPTTQLSDATVDAFLDSQQGTSDPARLARIKKLFKQKVDLTKTNSWQETFDALDQAKEDD